MDTSDPTLKAFGNGFRRESIILDELFSNEKMRTRCCRSWLRKHIEDYLNYLSSQGYSRGTMRIQSFRLLSLGEFMERLGVADIVSLPRWIEPFVAQIRAEKIHCQKSRLALLRFIRFLRQEKLIPAPEEQARPPHADLVEDYLKWLREQRGLRPASLKVMRRPCQALMMFVTTDGVEDLGSLRPEAVHRFLIWQAKQCNRKSLQTKCYAVRDFLSHLFRRGVVAVDLAAAVLTPRVYKHEQCPRFLTRAEIDAVLAVIDRDTPLGRRDYAMVLLLAVYGVRGAEVVHLRLEDIDWRRRLLHIRGRKGGNSTTYPLSAPVGDAILAFLQNGRPASTHREIFLTQAAPFKPFASGYCLTHRVMNYVVKAGVHVEKPGTHSFRYSCAQRLFEVGQPLKVIGDYLGHHDTSTTQRYTKIDFDQLRDVAIGDVEEIL